MKISKRLQDLDSERNKKEEKKVQIPSTNYIKKVPNGATGWGYEKKLVQVFSLPRLQISTSTNTKHKIAHHQWRPDEMDIDVPKLCLQQKPARGYKKLCL